MTTRKTVLTLLTLAACALIGAIYWHIHQSTGTPVSDWAAQSDPTPTAAVETATITEGPISITADAFGVVATVPGSTQTFSVPFESRVVQIMVVTGQRIGENDPLLVIEPSPDTRLRLDLARQKLEAARKQLALAQGKVNLQLGTRQDLAAARDAVSSAKLELHSLNDRGIGGQKTILSEARGIVSSVGARQGQIVPAGAMLAETVGQDQIMVKIGVEGEDAIRMQAGQKVTITPVNNPARVFDATVLRISRQVNPSTRLVNVYIKPENPSGLLLNEYVRALITAATRTGLLVPSRAIITEADTYALYTVEDGCAVKHTVIPGPADNGRTMVTGDSLKVGQQVVTVGVSQLTDGMAIKTGGIK
jgi:RND family efflux transporter MFP subunit